MSSYLKYLEKYEERGDLVFFYLKDYPMAEIAGSKIVRELYEHLFHSHISLEAVIEDENGTYFVNKKEERCLNCRQPIIFDEHNIAHCDKCGWRNEQYSDGPPDSEPIVIKREGEQIAFPNISGREINLLPEKQREAVLKFFKSPQQLTQNDHHNLTKLRSKRRVDLQTKIKRAQLILRLQDYL